MLPMQANLSLEECGYFQGEQIHHFTYIKMRTNPLPIKEARLTGSPLLYSTSLSMAFSTALDNALVSKLPQELKQKNKLNLCNKFLRYFILMM